MSYSEFWTEEGFKDTRTGKTLKYASHSHPGEGRQPLLFNIHGAGSRGDSLSLLTESESGMVGEIKKGRSIPAHIVMPQCYADTWFELFETLLHFVEEQAARPDVDTSRIYITGASMGGYTTWQLAMSRPELFAAVVPICGGGMDWNAGRLRDVPVWAFHGVLDDVVSPIETVKMVRKINLNGGDARITLFPHADHNAWDPTFSMDAMWDWMFSQKKKN